LAAAYLSDKGQLTGRIEASVDERVTRRIVLQPRVEFNCRRRICRSSVWAAP
jgi:copper resistance protein B